MSQVPQHLLPPYYQVKQYVRSNVENGLWTPGQLVPSETELVKLFGLARGTVRRALKELVAEGIIIQKQGRGTFVAQPKVTQGFTRLSGFSADMRRMGRSPEARVLEVQMVSAAPKIANALRLAEGDRVVQLKRLRLADGEPMNLETVSLPPRLFPNLLEEDLSGQSLYALITEKYKIPIIKTTEYVESIVLDAAQAKLLGVAPKSPAIRLERITETHGGMPIEHCLTIARGDRTRLIVETGPK